MIFLYLYEWLLWDDENVLSVELFMTSFYDASSLRS